MKFYSHSRELDDGTIQGSKLLKTHIKQVGDKALNRLYPNLNFSITEKEIRELILVITDLHDLGKYTSYFQNYLLKKEPIDYTLKQHAHFGSYVAFNLLLDSDNKQALIALYIILLHHNKLIALYDIAGKIDLNAQKVFENQLNDIRPILTNIEQEIGITKIESFLRFPSAKKIRKLFLKWIRKNQNIEDYFLINYLFSLLIEADKLDASNTPLYSLKYMNNDWVDKRFGTTKRSEVDLNNLSNDELRNYCRFEAINQLNDENILEYKLFTLTAPTGIGKTMTALDFALKLKSKLNERRGNNAQIIYALPFINIIEQAINEYEETLLEEEIRILGHYQFADVFGIQDDNDEDGYQQKIMELDSWQSDVVITSFVQFFETLISNKNKLLKKFNHFAGSIIILDEVQTLRLDYMPLIGAALYYLSKFLDARIIMMTATKPKIFDLAEQEILSEENEKPIVKELLTNHNRIFSLFERTTIFPIIYNTDRNDTVHNFVYNIFKEKWEFDKSCIIVCNTVNRSIEIFNKINEYLKSKFYLNPVYYLSTNILPSIRKKRITKIKNLIKQGEIPILVSTQVVEAGVDLDFDMGFRDLGPIDSIIQVAGRINRSNDPDRKNSPLYIVDFDDCQKVYGKLTTIQTKRALNNKKNIPESNYLEVIEKYFNDISDKKSFHTSRKYFESMKSLKYDSQNPNEDYSISSFRIIEESNHYRPVFIEIDNYSQLLRKKYLQKIKNEISKEEFDMKYEMDFQQHIITVPKYCTNDLYPINEYEENILVVPLEDLNKYYDLKTGFKRDQKSESFMIL
ncbi:MAG TPA: CRISPR-associated helicase Cas3' [Bacteroidales bacterium]|nr:CRISPR-associated helicase Cas3' [Bacteroidales bacterium]